MTNTPNQHEDDLLVNALLDILENSSEPGKVDNATTLSPLSPAKQPERGISIGRPKSYSSPSYLNSVDVSLGDDFDTSTLADISPVSKITKKPQMVSEIGLHSVSSGESYADDSGAFLGLFLDQPSSENEIVCPSCGAACPKTSRYCGACASYLEKLPQNNGIAEIPISDIRISVSLVSINEDSTDSIHIPLLKNVTVIGRNGDDRFPTDAFLSPKHARLIVEDRSLWIEDLASLNGTFLRIRNEVKLSHCDCFLAGRQLLRFERYEQLVGSKARSVDGTRYMGSPPPGSDYKLVQVGIGNVSQNMYCLPENGAVIGREKGDITFPKDRFMSGRHGQIYPKDDGSYYLLDLNSSNGTWIRINGRTKLSHGDLIFLGQQLFRIDSGDIV